MTKILKDDKVKLKELSGEISDDNIRILRGFLMKGYSFSEALQEVKENERRRRYRRY